MRINESVAIGIYNGSSWEDLTDGLITINAVRGCTSYSGPYSQPDVGQLQIVSRNPNLDPYVNTTVRYNNIIRIVVNGVRIFTGKIDGIDVQYRAKDNPIVTLTAIDFIGTMQKHVLSSTFCNQYANNWSTVNLFTQLTEDGEIEDWYAGAVVQDGTANVYSSIVDGTTAWNAIASRAITDLGFVYVNANNWVNYYRVPVTDPLHPNNARPIKASFDYNGSGLSYQSINLNDGFENIINQLDITGTHGYRPTGLDTTNVTETSDPSISLWGKSNISLSLATNNATTIGNIADAIFVEVSNPVREVYEITYDATLYPDIAKSIDILDNININHVITPELSINRKYSVVGIQHEIGYDYWRIKYVVKNWNFKDSAMATPEIHVSPTTGDQFTDWTFSYTIAPNETITSQYWTLGEAFTSSDPTVTVNYANPGVKNISLTVTNIYGWQKTVTMQLTVGAAPPIVSFTKTLISYNRYQFTFTGQEAASYSWNFGNGKTSTEQNPITYYTSTTPVTVTLTASNAYGSATSTETFTPVAVSIIPIRYVKFITWNYDYSTVDSGGSSCGITNIKVMSGATNVAANKQLIDVKEQRRFFTSSLSYLDTYRRRVKNQDSETANALLDENSSTIVYLAADQDDNFSIGDTGYTQGGVQKYLTPADGSPFIDSAAIQFTIDLGQEYFGIDNVILTKEAKTSEGGFRVLMSQDNSTWYNAGIIQNMATTSTNTTFTPTTTMPITSAWPTYDVTSIIQPVRYVKIVTNGTPFTISELVATSGTGQLTYGNTYKNIPVFGFGSQYIPNETGCRYFVGSNSATIYRGGYFPMTLHPGDEIPNVLNDRGITSNIYWTDNDVREIIMDFGTVHYNLAGFHVNTQNTSGVVTTTSSNAITFYISEDGVNWHLFDTLNLGVSSSSHKVFRIAEYRLFNNSPFGTESHACPIPTINKTISKGSYTDY